MAERKKATFTRGIKHAVVPPREQVYAIFFTCEQWEKLLSLWQISNDIDAGRALPRRIWVALGHIALGKAERIDAGDYWAPGDAEPKRAAELRAIAKQIFTYFRPGDGKL